MIRMKKKPKLRVVGPVDTEKLESFVKRIEAVESEEADYKDAKKDIYVEVKAAGLKPKLVRKIVKERKPKPVDEAEQAELETYREALGMASFAVRMGQLSLREAERAFGVSKSSIHRHLSVPGVSHDPDTGEITPSAAPHGRSEDPVPPTANPHDGEQGKKTLSVTPAPSVGIKAGDHSESCGDVESRHVSSDGSVCRREAQKAAGVAPGPQDSDPWAEADAARARVEELKSRRQKAPA